MASPQTFTDRPTSHSSVTCRESSRRGGALVELVIILPVMFLVILGSVDICNNIFAKQFLTEVTYQGALEGASLSMTETDLHDSIQAHLLARNVTNARIETQGVDGTAFDLVERGELFEVVVEVSSADREDPPIITRGVDLSARSVAIRQ